MFRQRFFAMLVCTLFLIALAACGSPASSSGSISANTATAISHNVTPGSTSVLTPTATATIQAVVSGKPGTGPMVIASPTIVPGSNGHAQQIVLPDRVLILEGVSQQPGTDTASMAISVTMFIKNTSNHIITNQASYFQLVGAEGDTFGLQSTAEAGFFGSIAANNTRSGTIVFQIPIGAGSGLHLLYSPDVTTEKTIVPLAI